MSLIYEEWEFLAVNSLMGLKTHRMSLGDFLQQTTVWKQQQEDWEINSLAQIFS